jgi:hypothetical protein
VPLQDISDFEIGFSKASAFWPNTPDDRQGMMRLAVIALIGEGLIK